MNWLNREKLFFVACSLALCLATVYAASSPESIEAGMHRSGASVPGRIEIVLRSDMEEIGGANPFEPFIEKGQAATGDRGEKQQAGGAGHQKEKTEVPHPLPPPVDDDRDRVEVKDERRPRPYELPANFRGVHRPSGGKWRVILEDKQTRMLRSFFEGDLWPSLKLRIIRITSNSVLLRNDEGKSFLMRDLYGRRSKKGHGDSARAGLRG